MPPEERPDLPRRVCVIGTCGSGKTTLAARLARILDCPHVELDELHWEPGWTQATPEAFAARVERATRGERWVADGNYSKVRDLLWARAETIVWLDLPFGVIVRRLVARCVRRAWRREMLWAGNRETFRQSFFSRDSVILWALRTHRRRRREYAGVFAAGVPGVELVRLRSGAEAEAYLLELNARRHRDWPVIAKIG